MKENILPGILIDNVLSHGSNKRICINPTTEEQIAVCSTGDVKDIDRAVDSSYKAFDKWSSHDLAKERGTSMLKFSDLVEKNRQKIRDLIIQDNGKPIYEADLEVTQVAAAFKYFSQISDKIHGETIPSGDGYLAFTDLSPLGVIGVISPWNFPIQLWAWRTASALAAGCTVVWKPAEETLVSAVFLCELIAQSFPPGVINVVNGKGSTIGTQLAKNSKVSKIAFTGSTEVGKTVGMSAYSSNLKTVGLELGGKSPIFVLSSPPSSSLQDVALHCHHALFWNSGQCCSAGSRVYVAEEIFEEFISHAVKLAKEKVLGDPSNEKTTMGPVINSSQQKEILNIINQARTDPLCKIIYEGTEKTSPLKKGYFVPPTVIVATHEAYVAREEIFGPVQVIIKLRKGIKDEEITHLCNDSRYGLAAAFFGETSRCLRLARKAEAGIVWVNDYNVLGPHIPFGGCKETGGSVDLGFQSLRNYTKPRVIVSKL